MTGPMGTQDLPSSQRASAAGDLKSEMIAVLKNIGNPKYVFTAGPAEKIGEVNARVLEINADGTNVKWYVDPATGKVLRTASHASGPMPGEAVTEFKEWKTWSGLNLPSTLSTTINGQPTLSLQLTNVELNPTVAPDEFKKPD
jgi:hypothetical protein